jgi:hypothetical protein
MTNIFKNILTLSPNVHLNHVAYSLTIGQNKLNFKYVFPFYGLGWSYNWPKDICLKVFIGLYTLGLVV